MKFALFCRVSTEQQERGESLAVQKATLEKCVKFLEGTIVKEYVGSESATEGLDKNRDLLDTLLVDASKKEFDAVIIYDLSRMTRDPIKSKIIFAQLKKYKVSLFVQSQNYDLNNPETSLIVGLLAEINAFQASIQAKKSIESKIELAKRGWLQVGRPPYGRKLEHNDHSKPPTWIIDEDKLAFAQKVYDLYINQNIYVDKIANILDCDDSFLFRLLKDNGELYQSFTIDGKKIVIKTPIPYLFTSEQREKILQQLKKNKKNNSKKYQYLLSGIIKCKYCNYVYIGTTTNKGTTGYYRHTSRFRKLECVKNISKTLLEDIVLRSVGELIANNDLLIQTVKQCNQGSEELKIKLSEEIVLLQQKKDKIENRKAKILKYLFDGKLEEEDVFKELSITKKKLEELEILLKSKQAELESIQVEVPEEILQQINYIFDCLKGEYGLSIQDWPFEAKSFLIDWFIGSGKIEIERFQDDITYTIHSNFGSSFGWLKDGYDAGMDFHLNEPNMKQFAGIIKNFTLHTNPQWHIPLPFRVHNIFITIRGRVK